MDETDGELTISVEPSRNLPLSIILGIWLTLAAAIGVAAIAVMAAGGVGWSVVSLAASGFVALVWLAIYMLVWNVALHERITVSREAIHVTRSACGLSRTKELAATRIEAIISRPIWPHASNDVDYQFLGRGLWHVEVAHDRRKEKLLRRVSREQALLVAAALASKGFAVTVAQLRMGEVRGS